MAYDNFRGSLNPKNAIDVIKFRNDFMKQNPYYFEPEGLTVFCGGQGTGKTVSAVQYIQKLSYAYPKAILCTNVLMKNLNPDTKVIEYDGINSLSSIENGYHGVMYFIDEMHLEFNSLESSSIPIEIFVEIAQQRKQRKTIIGTSQVFHRLSKPFREQIHTVILCKCFFKLIQYNRLCLGEESEEKDGKVSAPVKRRFIWFHTPELYQSYDTYQKMKRLNKEFKKGFIKKGV